MSSSIFSFMQGQLVRYAIPTIIILGDIGNIFIVILFSRRRRNLCSVCLLWIAVMNNIALTFNVIYTLYSLNYGDPTIGSPIFCKLRMYITQIFSQTARYLIVLTCIDRFLLITNRANIFRVINRPVVIRCLIGIIFIFWCIFLSHLCILTTISNGQCGQFGINYILYVVYLMTFVCLIPIVLIAIFGFLSYQNMRRLHTRVQPIMNVSEGNASNIIAHRRDRELLIMVFAEIIVYMVTTIPYSATIMEIAVTNFMGINKSIERRQIENFFLTLSSALIYLNCSAPFYMYLLISKPFRRDFQHLFTKLECQSIRRINMTLTQRTA